MFIWERIKINRRYLLIICCVLILFSRQSACVNAEQSDGNIRIKEVQQEIRKDKIEYIYEIKEGKLYKRLYNYSRGEWIGEWILCQ